VITVSWSMITVQYGNGLYVVILTADYINAAVFCNGRALSAATMHAVPCSLRSYDIAAAPRCRSATAGRKARDTAPGAELEQH
jgi:guanyl-specific ribonuclease Sa